MPLYNCIYSIHSCKTKVLYEPTNTHHYFMNALESPLNYQLQHKSLMTCSIYLFCSINYLTYNSYFAKEAASDQNGLTSFIRSTLSWSLAWQISHKPSFRIESIKSDQIFARLDVKHIKSAKTELKILNIESSSWLKAKQRIVVPTHTNKNRLRWQNEYSLPSSQCI